MPVTNYLWDPDEDNIVKELDEAGNTVTDYTTEPFPFGDVASQYREGQSRFYHFDTEGNTTALTDSNANVTDTRDYSAFGHIIESSGDTDCYYQYQGQKQYCFDVLTGIYSARRRFYNPGQARWESADPLGVRKGNENPYRGSFKLQLRRRDERRA